MRRSGKKTRLPEKAPRRFHGARVLAVVHVVALGAACAALATESLLLPRSTDVTLESAFVHSALSTFTLTAVLTGLALLAVTPGKGRDVVAVGVTTVVAFLLFAISATAIY